MEKRQTDPIYTIFDSVSRKQGETTAVIYLGHRYSYAELKELSDRFAAALADIGTRPGERVIIYIPNSIQWVVVWLAIQKMGAVAVPITPIYTPYDLGYIAQDSRSETIVCADTNFGYVTKMMPESGIRRVIITRMADLLPWWKRCFGTLFDVIPKGKVGSEKNVYFFKKMLRKYRTGIGDQGKPGPADENVAEILFTGGTTRYPKGVPITHTLFTISADEQIGISKPLFPAEKNIIMCHAPLFHILGQTCGLSILLKGGVLMLQPKVNLDATFESIQRFQAKTMIGVPALYRMILEHDRLDQYDLSSVDYWFSAGDVLPVEVGRRWYKQFGKAIHQGYGATETCGGVSMCPVDVENPPKSVGRILPSKKVKIVDPASLKPVRIGMPGELVVSSDHMVSRYLNKPAETASSFIELHGEKWYRTADIMTMDETGNLYFIDRTVDTIKHKGYRISASEVEAVLQEHPAVIGSCVVGIPDEKLGERIKAFVVLKHDIKGVTGYDLIHWCRDKLVSYKIPQYIEFRDMLPKSKVGKLLRREIRSEEQRRTKA